MTTYNIVAPGSMASGQPEDVSVILANFQAIAAILNGQLDNANIHPNANITASKLAGYPADSSKSLLGDGTWGVSAPSGAIMAFAGMTPPAGWLICDGSAISRTSYPLLFSIIGTIYGAGDGSTTFNLPDGRGRALYGIYPSTPGVTALGANEGQGDPALRGPHHGHSSVVNDPGHQHYSAATNIYAYTAGQYTGMEMYGFAMGWSNASVTGITISVGSPGYSTLNAPSHLGINHIIKT